MNNSLELIYDSAIRLLHPLHPEKTLSIAIEELTKLSQAEYGTIYLAKRGSLISAYSTIPPNNQLILRKKGFTYKAFKSGKVTIINKTQLKKAHPEYDSSEIKSFIIIPLIVGPKTIGVINLQSKRSKNFNRNMVRVLKLLSTIVALAIRNVELFQQTKEALDNRDLFISMASHELRTPLTTIYAYNQLISKKIELRKPIDPEWISIMLSETYRLTRLVNELLQINQIKTGELVYINKIEKLPNVAKRAIVDFNMTHRNHKLIFKNNLKANKGYFIGDHDKILQVIINLLNNAAKFSQKNTSITLSLDKDDKSLILRVTDQGFGIAKDKIPHIFDGFYKGEGNKNDGMGLGLFISKSIIKHHRGKIKVKSRVNKGTTFTVRLPKIKT